MKTYRLEKTGSLDNLSLNQEADPTPGAHDVVIRVRANALNYRDLMVMGGSYRVPPKPRVIPLSDGAGEIVAVGSAVKRLKIGDRVAGAFFQGWMGGHIAAEHLSTDMGGSIDGMLSEFVVLNEQGVVKIPAHLRSSDGLVLSNRSTPAIAWRYCADAWLGRCLSFCNAVRTDVWRTGDRHHVERC